MRQFCDVGPSQIGLLCEEMVDEYDDEITSVLMQLADNELSQAEESICVGIAHICTKKEYTRIRNYNYRNALGDFQRQQNIQSMSMDEYDELCTVAFKHSLGNTKHLTFLRGMEINKNIVKAVKFLSCDKETITSVASYRNVLYVATYGDKLLTYHLPNSAPSRIRMIG